MKVYISGRITGVGIERAESNFQKAEDDLKKAGYEPVNPMKLRHNHDKSWESYMKVDIIALCSCEAVYMLKNWIGGRGSTIEYNLGLSLGLKIWQED